MKTEHAFPQLDEQGLTLRDYFAAKAMQGFAADPTMQASPPLMAAAAYVMADAMMEERKRDRTSA